MIRKYLNCLFINKNNLKCSKCNTIFKNKNDFNKHLDDERLKILKLSECFSYPVDLLPESLECLWFPTNSKFNHPIDNLPQNITLLTIMSSNYLINKFPNLPKLQNGSDM